MALRQCVSRVILRNFNSSMQCIQGLFAHKSTEASHFSDPGVPRVAITKDKQTLVLYHPKLNVSYEDTIPIPREDPSYSAHESLETLVRERLDNLECSDKTLEKPTISNPYPMLNKEIVPTIMKLANMFYTTKHQWFPRTQKGRMKPIDPDRPRE